MSSSPYPEVPLGEVLTIARDDVAVQPGETYTPAGIKSFGKGLFVRPAIDGADTKYTKFNRLHEGQFVYSRLFGWEGALAIVPPGFTGLHVSHEFPTFDLDGTKLDANYLAWVCRWSGLWEALRGSTTGLGLRRQRVPVDRLLATAIPFPSLVEQRRLNARMSAVAGRAEAVRALSRRAAEVREAFTASVFSELVASAPSAQLGEVLTQAWDEVVVEPTETYRPAGIKSFGKGLFARPLISGAETNYKKFNRLREGQMVVSRLNGWEGAVDVVAADTAGLVASQEYPTFALDTFRLDDGYVRWLCRWPGFWDSLVPRGSMVRRKRVHPDRLLETHIPLPPLDEQRRLGAIGAGLGEAERKAAEMDRLLDALVPSSIGAALSGEL